MMVLKKNFFSFFYPHTLTFRLNRLTVSHKKCEGKCEGKLSPLTLALTPLLAEYQHITAKSEGVRVKKEK